MQKHQIKVEPKEFRVSSRNFGPVVTLEFTGGGRDHRTDSHRQVEHAEPE